MNFVCDSCQTGFKSAVAYSPSLNSEQLTETYCMSCVDKRTVRNIGRDTVFSVKARKD
ncbi:11240_t:CDS:2 [Entrophospora sp. SA101]|nr:13044_t:CDS:2 [Entrophospora sp. SA101]CAJ0868886.1 11240_t:CDS:2 [Entrophospora sp. SA101]